MKHLAITLLAAAAIVGSACQKQQPQPATLNDYLDQQLAGATTFEDSVVAINGSFVGGYFNIQAQQRDNLDRAEMLRAMRDVMAVDTANISYLWGLQMGMTVKQTYMDLAAGGDISKEAFIEAVSGAFRLDSCNSADVQELQPMFEKMFEAMQQKAKERREAEAYNSEAARQNRMLADAVAEELQSKPDYKPAGSEGVMHRVLTPGDGQVIDPNSVVMVGYTISRIASGETIRQNQPQRMFAGRPNNDVVAAVVPFMSMGETAEFFVPYQLAYGVSGNARLKVGPCESVMVKVSIAAVPEEK